MRHLFFRHIVVVFLCWVMLTALSACGGQTSGVPSQTGEDSPVGKTTEQTQTTSESASPAGSERVIVSGGATEYAVITSRTVSSEATAVVRSFISNTELLTGVKLSLYPESYTKTQKEIIVGLVTSREESVTLFGTLSYSDYAIRSTEDKIVVGAYSEEGLKKALNKLYINLVKSGDNWVVPANLELDGSVILGACQIPVCNTEKGRVAGLYACRDSEYEVCLKQVSQDEVTSYLAKLEQRGFHVYTTNNMAGNQFVTLLGEDAQMTVAYYPTKENTLRLIAEPLRYLPGTQPETYTRVTDTTFTQIGRKGASNLAAGMSYIMQLADGRFIIVDGGPANNDDAVSLLDYLEQHAPAGTKPVIAAWFITHVHSDHIALANSFLERFHDRVTVEMAAYNFPTYDAVASCLDINGRESSYTPYVEQFLNPIRKYWPEAKHWIIHAGQKIYLADAEIEVLFTHEDLFPGAFAYINHTSSAFRIKAGGKSVLILGDCEKTLCQQMADCYGSYLKSDMLQLSHHGVNGACMDIYRYADPDICFWPINEVRYRTDERCLGTKAGYEFNAFLRDNSIKVRQHYHSDVTTVIPMS